VSTQEQDTHLVKRGELDLVVQGLIDKEKSVIKELETILPHLGMDSPLRKGLETRLSKGLAHVAALEAGYLPVDSGFFIRTDTKGKWTRKGVKEALDSMPEEIKEAWKRAEKSGVFKNFAVSSVGGDPLLVGRAGSKNFLIGAWVNFEGGYSVGFRCLRKD